VAAWAGAASAVTAAAAASKKIDTGANMTPTVYPLNATLVPVVTSR
jgi:hypothetical protein